jgi:hypothetical protein
MLEEPTLLLRPWAGSGRAAHRARREIASPVTGAPLGFARWRPTGLPLWRRWLDAPVLAVHEAQDEPLLCTIQRFWWFGPFWEVYEADGHRVATVTRDQITDRYGRPLAVRRRGRQGTVLWARPGGGGELALVTNGADGIRLHFADDLAGKPFAKMALLAAALVREAGAATP